MPPRKRQPEHLARFSEPPRSAAQAAYFQAGSLCFSQAAFWQAHEAWESAWRLMGDGPEDDGEIVLRGLIQLAAACHGVQTGRLRAAANNLAKAHTKLARFPHPFWGVDLATLIATLDALRHDPDSDLSVLKSLRLPPVPPLDR